MEQWNNGKMGLGYWNVGLMAIFVITLKFRIDTYLLKTNIPSFQYSIIPS